MESIIDQNDAEFVLAADSRTIGVLKYSGREVPVEIEKTESFGVKDRYHLQDLEDARHSYVFMTDMHRPEHGNLTEQEIKDMAYSV